MSPDEAATRAKMKEAGYSEEEIQTMIDAGCTEMADQKSGSPKYYWKGKCD